MANIDHAVEALIDHHGVQQVLSVMSIICAEKAEHIVASYDDRPLARKWVRAANQLGRCSMSQAVNAIS
jgi:hypothetical protein